MFGQNIVCAYMAARLSVLLLLSRASRVYTYLLAANVLTFFMLEAHGEANKPWLTNTASQWRYLVVCGQTYTVRLTYYSGSNTC